MPGILPELRNCVFSAGYVGIPACAMARKRYPDYYVGGKPVGAPKLGLRNRPEPGSAA
jgi:hypothetical protein